MPLTNAMLIKNKAIIGGGSSGGSSGGGHAIQDSSGTVMSQQPTLQFPGDVEVADESTNNKTVVNIPKARTITWDEWQELPDEEKEQGKWNITGAPGVDGTINAELLTKLWENSDITAAFAPQDITILEMLDYNFLLYEVRTDNVNACYITCFAPRTDTTLTYAINTPTGVQTYYRSVRMIEDTSIRFGDTYTSIGSAAKSINNTLLIPYRIYGLKTAIDLKISAIASDVSTSASKCMLEDGTSVEDSIMSLEHAYESPDDINVLASQVIKLTRSTTGEEYSSVYTIPKDCYAEVSISVQGNGSGASNLAYLYLLPRYTTNVSTAVNNNKRIILLSLGSISAEGITKTIYLKKGSVIGAYLNVRSSGNANISVGLRKAIYEQSSLGNY